jgi:hypothetical protein
LVIKLNYDLKQIVVEVNICAVFQALEFQSEIVQDLDELLFDEQSLRKVESFSMAVLTQLPPEKLSRRPKQNMIDSINKSE